MKSVCTTSRRSVSVGVLMFAAGVMGCDRAVSSDGPMRSAPSTLPPGALQARGPDFPAATVPASPAVDRAEPAASVAPTREPNGKPPAVKPNPDRLETQL